MGLNSLAMQTFILIENAKGIETKDSDAASSDGDDCVEMKASYRRDPRAEGRKAGFGLGS